MTATELKQGGRAALWESYSRDRGAILVVGHGTRNRSGAAQLLDLVSQMRAKAPELKIEGCFLELAQPTIEEAIQMLAQLHILRILVVPVLLFTAAHAREDIPDAVAPAARVCGIQIIGQTDSLGTHASVLGLSSSRYDEVIALGRGVACPAGACARVHCVSGGCEGRGRTLGRVGLAMVGRGTSDLIALDHMRRLTELHVDGLSITDYETGFFAGGTPSVDALFSQAARWDCDTVIVQPHLLFEGELVEQLRMKLLACQKSQPERLWLIARPLGADPKLAEVFLDLAHDKILESSVADS